MHRLLAVLAIALLSPPAAAQTITDGDTLRVGGVTWRLSGIDAPELRQTCKDDWPAGRLATSALQAMVAGRNVICEAEGRDRYGRTIGVCRVGGVDLGAELVRRGWAWAFTKYSGAYIDQEDAAKVENLGIHKHACMPAWEWRAQQRK